MNKKDLNIDYVRFPKILLDKSVFPEMTFEASFLYAYLKTLKNLSIKNNFRDKDKRIVVYFDRENLYGWGRTIIDKALAVLVSHNLITIEKDTGGFNTANRYYVHDLKFEHYNLENTNQYYTKDNVTYSRHFDIQTFLMIDMKLPIDVVLLYSYFVDKTILSDLNKFTDKNGTVFIIWENKEIQNLFGWGSDRTVNRKLSILEDLNMINSKRIGYSGNVRHFYVSMPSFVLNEFIKSNNNLIDSAIIENRQNDNLEPSNSTSVECNQVRNRQNDNLEPTNSTSVDNINSQSRQILLAEPTNSTPIITNSSITDLNITNSLDVLESSSNTTKTISEEEILTAINQIPSQIERLLENSEYAAIDTIQWFIKEYLFNYVSVSKDILKWFVDEKIKYTFNNYILEEQFKNDDISKTEYNFKKRQLIITNNFIYSVITDDMKIKKYLNDDFDLIKYRLIKDEINIDPFIQTMFLHSAKIKDQKSYSIKSFVEQIKENLI